LHGGREIRTPAVRWNNERAGAGVAIEAKESAAGIFFCE